MDSYFRKFPKVRPLSEAIERGFVLGSVCVSEKLDGSNVGITRFGDVVHLQSRTRWIAKITGNDDVGVTDVEAVTDFRGFVKYMVDKFNYWGIGFLPEGETVYGEWLVPHTVKYPQEFYDKLYVFPTWRDCRIPTTPALDRVPNISEAFIATRDDGIELLNDISKRVADEEGRNIEGLVLIDENGMRAKLVNRQFAETFKELSGQAKGLSEPEKKIAALFPDRTIVKAYEKLVDEKGSVTTEDMPRLIGMLQAEFWDEFSRKLFKRTGWPVVNTGKLQREIAKKVREPLLMKIETGKWPVYFKIDGGA